MAAALLMLFFLVGWGSGKVKILQSEKLVDLNYYLVTRVGLNNADNESPAVQRPSEESEGAPIKNFSHTIVIRGERITYDGVFVNGTDALKNKLIENFVMDLGAVKLVDDFAEAHVYREVLAVLNWAAKDKKLKYTESE